MDLQIFMVPRAGVEPARVAPLVFETSASTDSAIWAPCGCVCIQRVCDSLGARTQDPILKRDVLYLLS